MTTVGFGDKVPRSNIGRLYAVFWILLGISLCSMFTATLTSEIIHARLPANTEMRGKFPVGYISLLNVYCHSNK